MLETGSKGHFGDFGLLVFGGISWQLLMFGLENQNHTVHLSDPAAFSSYITTGIP